MPPYPTPNRPTWTPPPQLTLPTAHPPSPLPEPPLQCAPPPRGGLWPTSTGGGGSRVQKRGDVPPPWFTNLYQFHDYRTGGLTARASSRAWGVEGVSDSGVSTIC